MTTRFTAIYEHGHLTPTKPVSLEEGSQVEVIVIPTPGASDKRSIAEILAEIAALPTEGGDPFAGRDHDRILYGESGAR